MSIDHFPPTAPPSAPRSPLATTGARLGRRALLPIGLAAGATSLASAPAHGADNPLGTSWREFKTYGLTDQDRHVVRRFSYGLTRRLTNEVAAAGSGVTWLEQQLEPGAIADPTAGQIDSWFPSLALSPQQLWSKFKNGRTVTVTSVADDFVKWTLARRVMSRHQLLEAMAEHWSNVLHVASPDDSSWTWRKDYDQVIRTHALGRFDEMLEAVVLHPAMLLYLDNYNSTSKSPNENLGRELLEIHTVGVGAGYTESDVLDSTRILTGWAVDRMGTWNPYYDRDGHHVGPVRVLGFQHPNGSADGRDVTRQYLRYLAHHPATADRVCRALAVRFSSDDPSPALVRDLAGVFTSSGTSIPATLRALVVHPEFRSSRRAKVRTPSEDYVATVRALGITITPPTRSDDLAFRSAGMATEMGQRPFKWGTPDGFPDNGAAWSTVSRMIGCWKVHLRLAARTGTGAKFQPDSHWIPTQTLPFGQFVRVVCRRLLFEEPSTNLLQTASKALNVSLDTPIGSDHIVVRQRIQLLLACLLDSPQHMER